MPSGKCLVLLWSIFSVFFTSFYTCNLRANFVSPLLERPLETIEEAVEMEFPIFLPDLPPTINFFIHHPVLAYRKLFEISQRKGTIYAIGGLTNEEAWKLLHQRLL